MKIGADARQARADRDLRKELTQKQLDADAARWRERMAHEVDMQGRGFTHAADQAERGFGYSMKLGDADRGHRTSERLGSQDFTLNRDALQQGFKSGESEKQRLFEDIRLGKQLDHDARQRGIDRTLRQSLADAELTSKNVPQAVVTMTDPRDTNNVIRTSGPAATLLASRLGTGSMGRAGGSTPSFGELPVVGKTYSRNEDGTVSTAPLARPAAPTFDPKSEGRIVNGPDGRRYVIKNGTPIPAN
ncbi:hypothetical protein [Geminisphaera colitermitum]|uniref:hypothetical protein n=1 Tax=Geminisphaera colitermitum TaxID=1148786 RepID=UPI0002D52C9E|nr:hypothetical protein [Geminisphaera colitermitum]